MAKFRLASISQLARQMEFAPTEVRSAQIARAEDLLHLIDPARAYPLEFVIYKITEYHPKTASEELLTGLALQHDLGLLIEQISATLNEPAAAMLEPVLDIDDVCAKFSVTSKTIQRWRRKGLPARRFIFPDGRSRVGFLLSNVERFLLAKGQQSGNQVNLTPISKAEQAQIQRHARRLAASNCTVTQLTRRIARLMQRSPLTILHSLRKADQDDPASAILPLAAPDVAEQDRLLILKAFRQDLSIGEIARRTARPHATVYQVLLEERIRRILKRRVRYFDDPLFHQGDAEDVIESLLTQDELAAESSTADLRVPRDLPPNLLGVYRTPLLTRSRERALFLKLNFHKRQFMQARRRLDPELACKRDLNEMEGYLSQAADVKNQIIRANLRLVVSIARRHLRPGITLAELLSDGTMTLMRAVESFDVSRGFRFSTYATLALMKGFARSVPQAMAARIAGNGGPEILDSIADVRHDGTGLHLAYRDEVRQLLSRLTDRERDVVAAHFGLDDDSGPATYEQVGQRLGLSKERVRQIEQAALAKLRAAQHQNSPELA